MRRREGVAVSKGRQGTEEGERLSRLWVGLGRLDEEGTLCMDYHNSERKNCFLVSRIRLAAPDEVGTEDIHFEWLTTNGPPRPDSPCSCSEINREMQPPEDNGGPPGLRNAVLTHPPVRTPISRTNGGTEAYSRCRTSRMALFSA